MDPAFLQLLRCPVTHQPLRLVAAAEATAWGLPARPVLLREDGRVYYAIDDRGFPHLLPDSGLPAPDRAGGTGDDAGLGADAD